MRKWKPIKSGTPYTCKDCPSYLEVVEQRDRWKRIATDLYHGRSGQFDRLAEGLFDYEKAVLDDSI